MLPVGERIREARLARNASQAKVAAEIGVTRQMVTGVEGGNAGISVEALAGVARALDVSADYLLGLTDDPAPAARRRPPCGEETGVTDAVQPRSLEAAARRGLGEPEPPEPLAPVRVPLARDWLARRDLALERCSLARMDGRRMEPAIEDGAWMLVDHRQRDPAPGGVYLALAGDGALVGRAALFRGRWFLRPDSPGFSDSPLGAGCRLAGRVVAFWRAC